MSLEIKYLNKTEDFLTFAYEFGDDAPLKRILLATEAVGCRTVIKETNFIDNEYSKEYDLHYKNVSNSKPPSEVVRLHFFEGIIEGFDTNYLENKKDAYLGYCTLRPLKYRKVCDAFVHKKIMLDEGSRFVYLTCEMRKKVRINEVEFEITGFPYIQQDGRIAACAQVSVSIVSQYLSWKDNTNKSLTAPEVTEIVKSIPPMIIPQPLRKIPTEGLDIWQIRTALEHLDYDPIVYDYRLEKKENLLFLHPEQVIYRYVESGIPVIVGIETARGAHAIVAIGHTFNPDYWWARAATEYYYLPKTGEKITYRGIEYHCSTSWIQNFIVQDDNLGPYYFIDAFVLAQKTSGIIIPLPKNIYLTAEDAEITAWEALYRDATFNILSDSIRDLTQMALQGIGYSESNLKWLKMFIDFYQKGDLILRTYLRKSSELIQDINKFTRTEEVRSQIQSMTMPEYVWVVEISWPDIFCYVRKKCGEIILDATANAIPDEAVLSIHLPGLFIKKLVVEDDFTFQIILSDDQPFRHYYRKKVPIPLNLPVGQIA